VIGDCNGALKYPRWCAEELVLPFHFLGGCLQKHCSTGSSKAGKRKCQHLKRK
jgi:hypothetical protein